jgi:Leucine-rich repeat (LRR) protein
MCMNECLYVQGILDLMRVGLASVPIETFQLTNLQELNLSDNKIVELPPEFARLSTLEQLQVLRLFASMHLRLLSINLFCAREIGAFLCTLA